MRIVVLVPTYRRPDDLRRCLLALDGQRREADRVLVVHRPDDEALGAVRRDFAERLPLFPSSRISTPAWCSGSDVGASVNRSTPSGPGFPANNSRPSRASSWTCGSRTYFESAIAHVPDASSKIVRPLSRHRVSHEGRRPDPPSNDARSNAGPDGIERDEVRVAALDGAHRLGRAPRARRAASEVSGSSGALGNQKKASPSSRDIGENPARALSFEASLANHSRLPQLISVAYTLKRHFANIITYVRKPINNAAAEGINRKIQMLKISSEGLPYRDALRSGKPVPLRRTGPALGPTEVFKTHILYWDLRFMRDSGYTFLRMTIHRRRRTRCEVRVKSWWSSYEIPAFEYVRCAGE